MDRRPRTDPVSGESYASLSVAVRYFYPDTNVYKTAEKGMIVNDGDIFTTGSYAEDLNLPFLIDIERKHRLKADIDTMVSFNLSQFVGGFILIDSDEKPGFCHIAVVADGGTSEIDQFLHRQKGTTYLKNNIFSELFLPSLKTEKSRVETNLETLRRTMHTADPGDTGPSPAFTFTDSGSILSEDEVSCFLVPLPEAAKAWGIRKRGCGWPTPGTIKDVLDTNCYLVSKANPLSECPDIEWRYSFSLAEIVLAKSLNHIQKVCYKVFKTLIKHSMKARDINIQSYFLKTTLFWACEQSPPFSWDLDSLGKMFLYLCDKLVHFLTKHELPHYFIPSNNLIEHVSDEEVKEWIRSVVFIRQNPLQCMRDFFSQYVLDDPCVVPDCVNIRHFYLAALDILRQKPINLEELATNIEYSLDILGFSYTILCNHEMVLSIAKTKMNIEKEMFQCERSQNLEDELNVLIGTFVKYLELAPRLIKLLPGTRVDVPHSEHVLQAYVSLVLHTELACLYFQKSQIGDNSPDVTKGLLQEAERYFHEDCTSQVFLDSYKFHVKYAGCLVVQGRFIEAFRLLLKHLEENKNIMSFVTYNRYTHKNVEPTLRLVHEYEGDDICYNASTFAHFLLAICCKEVLKNSVEIRKDYCQFWDRTQHPIFKKLHLQQDPVLFDACLSLRYGNVHEALCVLTKSPVSQKPKMYKCYCVAKMVKLLAESDLYPLFLAYRIVYFWETVRHFMSFHILSLHH